MTSTVLEITREYELSGWDLSDLLADPTEEVIGEKLDTLEEAVDALVAKREFLDPAMSPDDLLHIVKEYEDIVEKLYVLFAYGNLWFSSDTQSNDAITYRNRMQQKLTEMQNRLLFFDLWWKELDVDQASALMPQDDDAADYRHYLADLRRTKPFTLDEKSEQIINIKDSNGASALTTLYSMLTNRLEFRIFASLA